MILMGAKKVTEKEPGKRKHIKIALETKENIAKHESGM